MSDGEGDEEIGLDIAASFGAEAAPSTQVFSIQPDQFIARWPELRTFLQKMGRETRQGEVAFEFDKRFYRIHRFDEA